MRASTGACAPGTPARAAIAPTVAGLSPAMLLTAETIETRNYEGLTVSRIAVDRKFVHQIPEAVRPKPPGALKRFISKLGERTTCSYWPRMATFILSRILPLSVKKFLPQA